jgi:hypothetical protein
MGQGGSVEMVVELEEMVILAKRTDTQKKECYFFIFYFFGTNRPFEI